MPILRKLAIVAALMPWTCAAAYGQDLAPRAYVITPLHSNALTLTSTYYTGGLQFDGAVPITGATANVSVPILSYYHALNSFGLCKHRRDSAVWRGKSPRNGAGRGGPFVPIWFAGFGLPLFRKPEGRTGDAARRDAKMAPEDIDWNEPEGRGAHRTVRSHEVDQLGQ